MMSGKEKLVKEKSIGKNAVLNMIRQGLSVLFPLITYPYAMRVLGPESLGKVSYTQSIISYFALLAMLGVSNYIIREGARIRDDKEKFNIFVSEVYTINVIFTFISYSLLVVITLSVPKLENYRSLIFLQSISIFLTTFGIDWINTIYEDFLKITVRSICTYILTIVLLFVFVKDSGDYYAYALLTVITNGIICISNRITFGKYVKLHLTKDIKYKKHISSLVILFVNAIAITINTSFDTTMLGWIKGDYAVGVYSLSVKVYSVIKNIICAVYIVSLPRLSYYCGIKNFQEYKSLNTKIWSYIVLLVVPTAIGMVFTSKFIVYFMGGAELSEAVLSLRILSISLIFSSLSGIIMNSMNISLRRETENLIVTAASAMINVVLNFIFIPLLSYNGAAITTLISETLLLILCTTRFKEIKTYVDFKQIVLVGIRSVIGVIFMTISWLVITKLTLSPLLEFIVTIISSVAIYGIMMIVMQEPLIINPLIGIVRKIKN